MAKNLFFLLILAGPGIAFAQQNTTAAGGNATGSGGSASYSVGQVDHITQTGSGGNANQGVQQPYQFTTTKGEEIRDIALMVFPNPAANIITLSTSMDMGVTRADLFDANGKLVVSEKITAMQSQVDMSNYANGTYFLSVFKGEKLLKQFKIVKNR